MAAAASSAHRGATMALHSIVGFGLSTAGAWGIGVALDAAGGPQTGSGSLAALVAAGIALGAIALWSSRAAVARRSVPAG